MLDETTYYFTAFAIDQNNNIIDSQTLSITTDFGWHVTPNTLAYFPFKENSLDKTGNITLSQSGTKETIGFRFTNQVNYSASLNTSRFVSYWVKINSGLGGSGYHNLGMVRIGGMAFNVAHGDSSFRNTIQYGTSGNSTWYRQNTGITQGQWFHVAYGYNGSYAYFYINGVKTTLYTGSSYRNSDNISYMMGSDIDATISEFIISSEDRENDIIPFFNASKSKYGY